MDKIEETLKFVQEQAKLVLKDLSEKDLNTILLEVKAVRPAEWYKTAVLAAAFPLFLIILLPRFTLTRWTTRSFIFLLAALQGWMLFSSGYNFSRIDPQSFGRVLEMIGNKKIVLAIAVHVLASNLFLAYSIAQDAHRQGIWHIIAIPSIILTAVLGPIGYTIHKFITFPLSFCASPSPAVTAESRDKKKNKKKKHE